MPNLSTLASVLLLLSFTTPSFADIILNFRDPTPTGPGAGTAGETLETGTPFTVGGLTVTATPSGASLSGDGLLANSDSFGIDSNTVSPFTDIPDDIQFDGAETLAISFDKTIEITVIDLQGLVGTEVGRITAGGFMIDLFTGVPSFNGSTDVFTPSTPILVPAGTPVIFETIAPGAAFGLQGLTVNVVPATVPEPASIAMWSLLGLVGAGYGWRKRKRSA